MKKRVKMAIATINFDGAKYIRLVSFFVEYSKRSNLHVTYDKRLYMFNGTPEYKAIPGVFRISKDDLKSGKGRFYLHE